VALEHRTEARWKQDGAVFGALAPIDENLAGLTVHVASLDMHALAHGRIAEPFEQDLVRRIAAVLEGSKELFQFSFAEKLR
jgi:hypothetical protein